MKLTIKQLKGLIKEAIQAAAAPAPTPGAGSAPNTQKQQQQQELLQALLKAESAIGNLIKHVEKALPGSSDKFRAGSTVVNLHDVSEAISENRSIEQDAPEYGGGMYRLPAAPAAH